MCTGFYYRGKDFICGFNFDVDPALWPFTIYKARDAFAVAITVRGATYFAHGVTRDGNFAVLPYMNDFYPVDRPTQLPNQPIEIIVDNYLRGKMSFDDLVANLSKINVVNSERLSMHALFTNNKGDGVLVEPRCGNKILTEPYFVITNYPLLKPVYDESEYYGKDRYKAASKVLEDANEKLTPLEALKVLEVSHQEGRWGTKVSFVYSRNENAVYYVENHDFAHVQKFSFN